MAAVRDESLVAKDEKVHVYIENWNKINSLEYELLEQIYKDTDRKTLCSSYLLSPSNNGFLSVSVHL